MLMSETRMYGGQTETPLSLFFLEQLRYSWRLCSFLSDGEHTNYKEGIREFPEITLVRLLQSQRTKTHNLYDMDNMFDTAPNSTMLGLIQHFMLEYSNLDPRSLLEYPDIEWQPNITSGLMQSVKATA